ncbi:hypothetical protein Btru_004331 [Bulinus truncatus]|nr:hypothetical protein Btru_004331 [Bulinus truncatus]
MECPSAGNCIIMDIIEDIISSDLCDSTARATLTNHFIDITNTGTLLSSNCSDMLTNLLKKKNRSSEEENIIKILVWWNLAKTLGSMNVSAYNMVINHLLVFCLTSDEGLKSAGKNKKENIFERLTFEAIFQVLETKKVDAKVDNDLENYQWTLESLPVEVTLDSPRVTTLLLDALAKYLRSTTKDFEVHAAIPVKISLQLCQRIKGANKELYIKFLKYLQLLAEKKILKEEMLVELLNSSSFIMDEILSSLFAACQKNEQTTIHPDAVSILLDIHTQLFVQITIYENLCLYLENLTSSLLTLFNTPVDLETVIPSFTSQLARLWEKLCQCVTRIYGSSCRMHDLKKMFPLLECALLYPHRNVRKNAQKLWTSTFSHLLDHLYPESLKAAVKVNGTWTDCVDGLNSREAILQNQIPSVPCTSSSDSKSLHNNEVDEICKVLKKFHINKSVTVNLTRLEDDIKSDLSEKAETVEVDSILTKEEKQQMVDDCLKKALERIEVYKIQIEIKILKIQ